MAKLESNIVPITNLDTLSSQYYLFRIKGLRPEQQEYYRNRQQIINKLSRELRNPVTIIEKENTPYLVLREDASIEPPDQLPLTRRVVHFEQCPDVFVLDYTERSPLNDAICLRFINFALQGQLYKNLALWQPRAGAPFFQKKADIQGQIARYSGFISRAVITHEGGIGIAVDVTSKMISDHPLPTKMTRSEFHKWKGAHCIYQYGHRWYEITVRALSDFSVSEHLIVSNGSTTSLIDYIIQEVPKPLPSAVAQIPHDASVILFYTEGNQERSAPATLCYRVYGPHDAEARRQHRRNILPAHVRQQKIAKYVKRYLRTVRMGEETLTISSEPLIVPDRMFVVPDLRFGQETVLSVRGTESAQRASLSKLGEIRNSLLIDQNVGFYIRDPLLQQYLILPESVNNSFGQRFVGDLKEAVQKLFPIHPLYEPHIEVYDDSGPKTFAHQGNAIREALAKIDLAPGHAVIMTHYTTDRGTREEHQLDAMAIRELREMDIFATVIHTEMGQKSYHLITTRDGELQYVPRHRMKGKLTGYLRNVALSKILLANQRWPFILNTKLNADLTIGIDVKNNTAGLLVVGEYGSNIRPLIKESKQKERLLAGQLRKYLIELITEEANISTDLIQTIVIHRDGRMYQSEIEGAYEALNHLKSPKVGIISPDATLTILEIPKTPAARVRLFDVARKRNGRSRTNNPEVGNYYIMNDCEAYLCSTGQPFLRDGTVRPLYVRKKEGPLALVKCLEDIYALTVLTWTKPDDCLRNPITIKLNDQFLKEDATDYNEDELEFSRSEGDEDE